MDWSCPHCGTLMNLTAYYGQFFLVCPRENDGLHPRVVTWASNNTNSKMPDALRDQDSR